MRLISESDAIAIWYPVFAQPRLGDVVYLSQPGIWGDEIAARLTEWHQLLPEIPPNELCAGLLDETVRAFGWWCGRHLGRAIGRTAAWAAFRDEALDELIQYRVVADEHEGSDIGLIHPLVQEL